MSNIVSVAAIMSLKLMLAVLVLSGISVVLGQTDKSIRCPLVWKSQSNGDPIPKTAVPTHKESVYIARGRNGPSGAYLIGSYVISGNNESMPAGAYIPALPADDIAENSTSTSYFDVLTNPHGCSLEWKPFSNGETPPTFTTSGQDKNELITMVVGRGMDELQDGRYFSGGVSKALGGALIAFTPDLKSVLVKRYDILVSFSTGLTLEVADFEFDEDPFGGGSDFLGVDLINNQSPATIRQSLTHMKRITEVYTVTTNKTWTSTYTETFKLNFIFFSVTKTTTKTYSRATSESVTTTEETEVSVTRDLVVPPMTSVQACSVVSIKESANIRYQAVAKYSAPGLKSTEVQEILQTDGVMGSRIDGDFVVVDASGEFTAKLAMNTEFIVLDGSSSDNCNAIEYRILEQQRVARKLKSIN